MAQHTHKKHAHPAPKIAASAQSAAHTRNESRLKHRAQGCVRRAQRRRVDPQFRRVDAENQRRYRA